MILYLVGHDYRFALEEGVVSFTGFRPDETVVCGALEIPEEGDCIVSRLTGSEERIAATAFVRFGAAEARGLSRASVAGLSDYDRRREESHALKIALYKAVASLMGEPLPWGSLSGMRPSKLAAKLITGSTERQARRTLEKRYLVSPDRARLAIDAAREGLAEKSLLKPDSIGLYLGVPFCPTRCAYCSFVSASVSQYEELIEPYTQALIGEIERRGELVKRLGMSVDSVYMGGGTPTTLSADQLDRVLGALERCFELKNVREFTVEAGRPDTIDAEKLAVMRGHRVDRISVNPQSMRSEVLARAGRPHTPEDVERAFREVRDAGFECINMDLIAGLPKDTVEGFEYSVKRILDLDPENITVHTLALKRGAALADGEAPSYAALMRSDAPDADDVCAMVERGSGSILQAGYTPYYLYRQKYMAAGLENVGWTKAGFRSAYNICIMEELCSIISLGCGGVTKLMLDGGIKRVSNPKYPREYIALSEADWSAADRKIEELVSKDR